MRVLLTGAAGFVGSAVDAVLTAAGHDVVGVDALLPQAHGSAPADPGPRVHRLDVRDAPAWAGLLDGVDAVCHQAAMVGTGVSPADLPRYASHNDLGTAALLAAMATAGVDRLVQASSMVVYGEGRYTCPRGDGGHGGPGAHGRGGSPVPGPRAVADLAAGRFENPCPECGAPLRWGLVDEGAPLDPRSAYAASKVAQEHYAAAWARQVGARAISLRYHNVYGPGMPRDTPYSGVAALFRSSVEAGRPPEVFEDGGQVRDFVHVDDVALANLRALEALAGSPPGGPAPGGPGGHRGPGGAGHVGVYNVCSGTPVTVLEVARAVAAGLDADTEPVVSGRYRLGDVRHVVASPVRAREELGFTARVRPHEGLAAFATAPLRPAGR